MITSYERIKSLDCREFAKFLSSLDLFCEMCAYDLKDCKSKCVAGHEIWLEQKYTEKQKEKLPRNR